MRCDECRFWEDTGEPKNDPDAVGGTCKCRAPIAVCESIMVSAQEYGNHNQWPESHRALWPTTHCDDWCGEFQATQSQPVDVTTRESVKREYHCPQTNAVASEREKCAKIADFIARLAGNGTVVFPSSESVAIQIANDIRGRS